MGQKQTFLADFHVHTNFSDGKMALKDVIDLYGQRGFGAIAITDHIAEKNTWFGKAAVFFDQVLTEETFPKYMDALKSETERAWQKYRMVVLPGFELSKNSVSNRRSAHILGIGITDYMAADGEPQELTDKILAQGGISIAAHPVFSRKIEKQTYYLWDRREALENCFDAWEVASGPFIFDEVKDSRLPRIASGDVHIARQIHSWKTQLTCEKKPEAILEAIRKQEIDFKFYEG